MTDRASRKVRTGVVVSDARDKTVTVEVPHSTTHPRYEKVVRTSTKHHAHDESKDAHDGDTVRIVGFGNFQVAQRKASIGRNPRTGAEVQIPASRVPKFRAGKALKEAVNG